jgi:3'-phosphoadenosine 5'-phosphosulfate sulfotransferase (PAPS reductase)/FAD synthetase
MQLADYTLSVNDFQNKKTPWSDSMKLLLNMKLEGIKVQCPKCKSVGLPVTRWVKGSKNSPLYVFHQNWNRIENICLLKNNEADIIRGSLGLNEGDIKHILNSVEPYVLFSGGKDSLCTLDYIRRIGLELKKDITALHVDTTAGFPEVTEYVIETCEKLNVRLEIVKPKRNYCELAKRWGIPSHNSRWCCKELKIRPLRDFLKKIEEDKIVFDGIRAVESNLRAKYLPIWFHPSFNCLSASPIFHWSDEDVRTYIKDMNLPQSPVYKLGTSAECWCGAYKKKSDFEKLYQIHPEIYHKLAEIERENKYGFTFIYEKGERITLDDFESGITRER